jgi:GrpB-like predicted nucleotidyltransferase (UPF0157 family)
MKDQPIEIAPYDPRWPDLFAEQRDRVTALLCPLLAAPVEHFGSTAVSGTPPSP